jgi:hypothetical protein
VLNFEIEISFIEDWSKKQVFGPFGLERIQNIEMYFENFQITDFLANCDEQYRHMSFAHYL